MKTLRRRARNQKLSKLCLSSFNFFVHHIRLKLQHSRFPLRFLYGILSQSSMSSPLWSIFKGRSYSKSGLLRDGRLKVTVVKWEIKCALRCNIPCGTHHVHAALHLNLMSGVELSATGGGSEERAEVRRRVGSYSMGELRVFLLHIYVLP